LPTPRNKPHLPDHKVAVPAFVFVFAAGDYPYHHYYQIMAKIEKKQSTTLS
jgi:hypothetical protein